MGRVVVTEFITLDGVIQDPGGQFKDAFPRGGWAFHADRGPDGDKFKMEELMASDAQLLGRVTYEGFAAAWPTMTDTGEFGEKMNGMPKYVVSATLEDPTWNNTTVIPGDDLAAEVGRLKEEYAGDILVAGSATLVQSLLALDLVDELRLMVFPVLLGDGKKLFVEGVELPLELGDVQRTGDVATLTFRRPR